MSKGFLVAFVAVTGVALAAVDYVNETRRAGLPLGGLAPGDYGQTIAARLDRDRAAPVVALPAPETVAAEGDTAELRRQRIEADLATLMLHEGALDVLRRTGQVDAATLASAQREIDRLRARLEAELAALDADDEGGGPRSRFGLRGVVAYLAGVVFARDPAPEPALAEVEVPEVAQSLFEGNCTTEGTFKRCRIAE